MAVLKTSHKSVRLYWPACPDTFSCSQHLINILGTSMGLCVLTLQRPKIFKIKHEDDPKYEWLEFMAWCRICQRRPRASNFFSMSTERHRTLHNLHSKQLWRQIDQKGSCAQSSSPRKSSRCWSLVENVCSLHRELCLLHLISQMKTKRVRRRMSLVMASRWGLSVGEDAWFPSSLLTHTTITTIAQHCHHHCHIHEE